MEKLLQELYQWVQQYIRTFYTDDPEIQSKISLKEKHTQYVTAICKELAQELKLTKHDQLLAEMIGLFHDIGRFKQYSIYQTFNDHLSENHAQLGLREIADLALLKRLNPEDQEIFRFAIANHNAMKIAPSSKPRHNLFAQIIRDSDKLDIYRVLAPSLHPSDGSGCNSEFRQCFLQGEQCDYTKIKTPDDQKLVRLLWLYDIYFTWTMQQIIKRGYAEQIVACLPQTDEMQQGASLLQGYMQQRVACQDSSILGVTAEKTN